MIRKYLDKILIAILERALRKRNNLIWTELLSKFKFLGSVPYIGEDFKFLNPKYITIGKEFSAGIHFRMEAIDKYITKSYNPQIVIGNNVSFEDYCHVGCIDSVVIEDDVMIASKVIISDHFHGESTAQDLQKAPRLRKLYSKGPILIKQNVWIGDNVSIFSGVTIGENSVVGANSVVTKDIPANAIVAGVPAKIITQY